MQERLAIEMVDAILNAFEFVECLNELNLKLQTQ